MFDYTFLKYILIRTQFINYISLSSVIGLIFSIIISKDVIYSCYIMLALLSISYCIVITTAFICDLILMKKRNRMIKMIIELETLTKTKIL